MGETAPEEFVLPTPLLVELLRLVGSLPAAQRAVAGSPTVARIYTELEQVKPVEAPAEAPKGRRPAKASP